MAKKV